MSKRSGGFVELFFFSPSPAVDNEEENNRTHTTRSLAEDVWLIIISLLDGISAFQLSQTCKDMYKILTKDRYNGYWRQALLNDVASCPSSIIPPSLLSWSLSHPSHQLSEKECMYMYRDFIYINYEHEGSVITEERRWSHTCPVRLIRTDYWDTISEFSSPSLSLWPHPNLVPFSSYSSKEYKLTLHLLDRERIKDISLPLSSIQEGGILHRAYMELGNFSLPSCRFVKVDFQRKVILMASNTVIKIFHLPVDAFDGLSIMRR